MINIPLSTIKEKIKEKGSLSDEEVNAKIKAKLDQLSGLISEEGAAHIIANELGVKLQEVAATGEKLQVKNILAGMRNVEVVGKISRKYELREFATEKRSGKVASFMISDETGFIRVVLWNDQTDVFEKLKEGDTIKIKNSFARENNGRKELHLSTGSELEINPAGVTVEEMNDTQTRKSLKDLAEGDDNIEVLATIVQVFDPRFFEVCPDCGKRARPTDGQYNCPEHGVVRPDYGYVMNLFLDDGTDNVRTVLWKNQTQRLLGKTHEEVLVYREKPELFESFKTDLLGTIVKVVGRTNKNEAFDRIELVANMIFKDVKPDEEISRLKDEVKKAVEVPTTVPSESATTEAVNETQNIPAVEEAVEENISETIEEDEDSKIEDVENAVLDEEKVSSKDDVMSIDDLENI